MAGSYDCQLCRRQPRIYTGSSGNIGRGMCLYSNHDKFGLAAPGQSTSTISLAKGSYPARKCPRDLTTRIVFFSGAIPA